MESGQNNVVLVAMSEGIIVKGIERKLSDIGIDVSYSAPLVNQLSRYEETAAVYVVYIAGDLDSMIDALVYVNDVVKETEKDLLVICENTERNDLHRDIPGLRVTEWFIRPLDMEAFVYGVNKLLKARASRMSARSILVVDDDPSYVRIAREWLKDDYQVFIVTSGMQALTFLMKKTVDLVLLDYEMPVTTGPQVLRMLRSEPDTAGIPVVFLTGIGDAESVKQVIALKPDGYILKSTSKPDLLRWLKVFFSNR